MRVRLRTFALRSAAIIVTGSLTILPAEAIQFWANDVRGNIDITLTYGMSFRASDRDSALIGRQNGGLAHSINGDDGNLNYDQGDIFSNAVKAGFEVELEYKELTLFSRFFTFYDYEVIDGDTRRSPLGDGAQERSGRDFRLLDLYGSWNRDVGNGWFDLRVGNMVLNWGESTFIPNGLNSMNPFDVSKFRTAGAEVKDALTAVPRANLTVGAGERFSLEGYYELDWEQTYVDPSGTYFSTSDFAGPDGEIVYLNFGNLFPDGPMDWPATLGTGQGVTRIEDGTPRDDGQFGVVLRYYEPNLADTEFALYYTNRHSRLPLVSGMTGTAITGTQDYINSAHYFFDYPEDISTLGFSFNREVGTLGALQGEISVTKDQPLQIDDVEILFAALSPLVKFSSSAAIFGFSQLGTYGFGEEIVGYRRKDVVQAQATWTKLLGPGIGDQMVLLAEVGMNHVLDMEDQDSLRYEAGGTYTSGTSIFTDAGLQPETEGEDGFADATSWGYRLLARAEFNGAIGAINLLPTIAWFHDVSGNTPSPILNFKDGRKRLTTALTAEYLLRWKATVSYTSFFGGGRYNLRNDRDFVSTSISYAF